MPGLNQTGPMGQGSMTGRRLGRCNSSSAGVSDHEFKNAVAGLVTIVIIGIAERIWDRFKVKRLKKDQQLHTN